MAEAVNHPLPSVPVSWLKRDILLFAKSINIKKSDLHYLYELHPSFAAFPTYPIILSFKTTSTEVVDFIATSLKNAPTIPGVPKFDPARIVDGERRLTVLKQIPTSSEGREFELRGKVLGVYDKGKAGTVTEMEHTLVDKRSGEAYTRIVSSSFAVGQGGWGGPKGPKAVSYSPPTREPDRVVEVQTSEEQALLYRLNGDYNPLHAEPSIGKKMGFPGAILHGLASWNMTCYAVLREFGESEPELLREFQARFASPVVPGDVLVVKMWRMGKEEKWDEVLFEVVVRMGARERKVLSNGRALVKVAGRESKL